jgi:hypothetical protein
MFVKCGAVGLSIVRKIQPRSALGDMVMNDRIFRENIAHLTEQRAIETSAPKRQRLARRIRMEFEKLAAADRDAVKTSHEEDGDYWKSRAERTRQRAQQYRSEGLRDHFSENCVGL